MGPGAAGVWHGPVRGVTRWRGGSVAARERSRNSAAAAARAAPRAIKVICQPAMPPVVITRAVAGTGARGWCPRPRPVSAARTRPWRRRPRPAGRRWPRPGGGRGEACASLAGRRPGTGSLVRSLCDHDRVPVCSDLAGSRGPLRTGSRTMACAGQRPCTPLAPWRSRGQMTHRRPGLVPRGGRARPGLRSGPGGSGRRGGGSRSCPGSGPGAS